MKLIFLNQCYLSATILLGFAVINCQVITGENEIGHSIKTVKERKFALDNGLRNYMNLGGSRGLVKYGSSSANAIKNHVNQGREIVKDIFQSFGKRGNEEQLEEAFNKYDVLMEDIEADLTKTKIAIGLRLEESLKRYNQSTNNFFRRFRSLNGNLAGDDWSRVNNGVTQVLMKRFLRFNDFLNLGMERFLDFSERGMNVLRRLYKRRYQSRQNVD